jgi:hypothetical protein
MAAPRRVGRVVDGTGLENRHTLTGIGGSNPSLSATQSALQRMSSRPVPNFSNNARIPRKPPIKADWGERTAAQERSVYPAFLRAGNWQSDF